MEKNKNMDTSETNNDTPNSSYLLSSSTSTYSGLIDADCSIDLNQILKEYSSILNFTEDSDEFTSTNKTRPSLIISDSQNNYEESEKADVSQIRDNHTFSDIGNIVNHLSLSEMSFCMEKMENSICSNVMSYTGKQLNWIVDNLPNNYNNIDNELNPTWNSIIDMSFGDMKTNPSVSKERSYNFPDIMITESTEDDFVNNKIIYDSSKPDSMNLLKNFNIADPDFFTRREKKVYFLSPRKLIDQGKFRDVQINEMENMNGSLLSSRNNRDEEEDLFKKVTSELSSFRLEDITIPQWPSSFNKNDQEDGKEEFFKFFETSTLISPHEISASPFSAKNREKKSTLPKFDFGVSATNFFSRKEGSKYFNTSKKIISPFSAENREEKSTLPKFDFGVSATNFFSRKKGSKYFNTPKK